MPAPKRGEILFKAAEILLKKKQEPGELVMREMGKIFPEGLGDIQKAIDIEPIIWQEREGGFQEKPFPWSFRQGL